MIQKTGFLLLRLERKKEEIQKMKTEKAEFKGLKDLNTAKSGHSKVMKQLHLKLQIRKYLQHNQTKEDSHLVFSLRSRMTYLKTN